MNKSFLFKSLALALIFPDFSFAAEYTPPSAAQSKINSYRNFSELTEAASGIDIDTYTYNMTTWQIFNGGFFKAMASEYKTPYSSGEKSSWRSTTKGDLGTIDNNATIQEMRLLATRYKETTNATYKETFKTSFNKAIQFLLEMQRTNGGFPQVWPKRGNYSDQITLNDNAMIRVLVTLQDIAEKTAPFDSDIISDTDRNKIAASLEKAIDMLLKAQIKNNGVLTVWCAQHDTATLTPVGARAYELPSKSGSESAGVVWFLMNLKNQTEAVQTAVKTAIAWYKKNKVSNLKFDKNTGNFVTSNGASMWYRFYEVDNDAYFFCDREGESSKTQDIAEISEERRTGYQWGGDYASALLNVESDYLKALEDMEVVSEDSSKNDSLSSNPEQEEKDPTNAIVKLKSKEFQNVELRIFDIQGKLVRFLKTTKQNISSELNKLPAGSYLTEIRQDGKVLYKKLYAVRKKNIGYADIL